MSNGQFWLMLPQVINLVAAAVQYAGVNPAVPKFLGVLAQISAQGEAAYDALTQLKDLVVRMIAEGREPTDDEWEALRIRSEVASDTIQSYDFDNEVQLDPGFPRPVESTVTGEVQSPDEPKTS